jgi:hypothetical protein
MRGMRLAGTASREVEESTCSGLLFCDGLFRGGRRGAWAGCKTFRLRAPCTPVGRRKRDPSKTRIHRRELHANFGKPGCSRAQVDYLAGHLFAGGDIPHVQRLSFAHRLLQLQQRSVRVYDQRFRVFHERCPVRPLSRNPRRHRQQNPLAAALIGRLRGSNVGCAHGLVPLLYDYRQWRKIAEAAHISQRQLIG